MATRPNEERVVAGIQGRLNETMNRAVIQKRTARQRLPNSVAERKSWISGKERSPTGEGSQESTWSESSLDSETPKPEGRNPSQRDERKPKIRHNDFIDRFKVNVTVSKSRTIRPSRLADQQASQLAPELQQVRQLDKESSKRRVRFHRYDEHIYDGCKEYVYSLHDREVQAEAEEYDIVDEVEEFVGDVAYFFRCLKDDLHEKAMEKMRQNPTDDVRQDVQK